MARYNVAAGNVSAVRDKLGFTSAYMGWVLSAGSWAYAISGPFTGQITDRIGGKRGMLVACLGAAICNLLLGVLFLFSTPGAIQQILFVVLYAANVLVQGFGTSAVVKINAACIVGSLGWPYVFVIPGAVLFEMTLVISRYVKNSPSDTHNFTNKQLILISPQQKTSDMNPSKDLSKDTSSSGNQTEDDDEKIPLTPKQQMKQLMRNYTFLGYLVAQSSAGPGRWGGFVGGILCGWLSDVIFHSDRVMPIFIFSLLQAFMLGLIYFVSATCSVAMLGGLIFLSSVFLLGNYTLLSYTVPSDLPRDIAAGASGIMTAVGYFSTGLSGAMMGEIIDGAGYGVWALSLMTASVLAGVFTKLGSYLSAKRPKHHAVIAPLPPKVEERMPLAPDSSDN
ncbi:hypothetical protein PF002_g25336 [Phytophthora fragariae]|uniref:Major facilitator superfamily (MFS) profile domain-containing protein n=1 Tax=Phytophthora fragariae TaxID=53985 RepID=A0A6A3RKU3_9STRA|nr:hypothetical protein PF006_g23500 [Phytophthora fragariae]KAE9188323.1 hypothetical protein PF002_g25336 [Phytophthora fragariae]KAE9283270.1 hypothetical protein PF001_g22928 [Phytophthora fragariae]